MLLHSLPTLDACLQYYETAVKRGYVPKGWDVFDALTFNVSGLAVCMGRLVTCYTCVHG